MTNKKDLYLGDSLINSSDLNIEGKEVVIKNENFYKISNVNKMRPFFMSIVSAYDHWLFISSTGALSAGRKNSNNALFPYYTDDKISESHDVTGSKSIFHVNKNNKEYLWEPFTKTSDFIYQNERNLYKNLRGNKVIFEEINNDLGLKFSYQWTTCDKYGFIKTSSIKNLNNEDISITLVDGFQNILPWGLDESIQNNTSNLADAYKRNELDEDSKIGIFALSATIVDRAEPSEALKSNIVFHLGLDNCKVLLSSQQLDKFRKGHDVNQEIDVKAEKGAYFTHSSISLKENEKQEWLFVGEINKSSSDIVALKENIVNNNLIEDINQEILNSSNELYKLVGSSDGIQLSSDRRRNIRHFANTLFNIMRGGIFDKDYLVEKNDFIKYLDNASKKCGHEMSSIISEWPDYFDLHFLRDSINQSNSKVFKRLATEYLPIKFSRRHGDPSRPWNKFSINTRDDITGEKVLDYQGNWRDIFQNWEALAYSYPQFIDGMIYRFLNASTFDGYNPYRLTKDGFDWETIEPDNPWSYIGYWGDHQIIYLLKFLEFTEKYFPQRLNSFLTKNNFVYANVPYEIKDYKSIYKDPKNTIDFNFELAEKIEKDRLKEGADGAILKNYQGSIHEVNFFEKILTTILAKLSNFIPGAGIWMNTQRPEWNDANNALVGSGVSMVTLYYLRRFLNFFIRIIKNDKSSSFEISTELYHFFEKLNLSFSKIDLNLSNRDRKKFVDDIGEVAAEYRDRIYTSYFSGTKELVDRDKVINFLETAQKAIEQTIDTNKREDGLYHAYNLVNLDDNEISINRLSEMLEGQVGILSSGYLSDDESLSVLDSLKSSSLFWDEQYSYILYPNKDLLGFLDKNIIPENELNKSSLLTLLVKDGNNQIVVKDIDDNYHFNGLFHNASCLISELENLPSEYIKLVKEETDIILEIFECVFDHKSFTGRSGTFYGYEGLGSIYWHMVSKLLLASVEVTQRSIDNNSNPKTIGRLFDHYFEINEGIGVNKSPELYGAFPTDPYSHTPRGRGVQQPGMTGQVKEDVISRFHELGFYVNDGKITFEPTVLRKSEFIDEEKSYKFVNLDNEITYMDLNANSLAFTVCQVPIIYNLSDKEDIKIITNDGGEEIIDGHQLNFEHSQNIFNRTNFIKAVHVRVSK
ncbi:hypothetical protein N9S44_03325 [Gammaproteobacteria bacterium]|nr:hypothetical protein [Gammaproteobacteria bacterium]